MPTEDMPHIHISSRGPLPAGRVLLVSLFLLATVVPSLAHAGTYEQFVCQRPDGSPAPADNWRASGSLIPALSVCDERGGAIQLVLPDGPMAPGTDAMASWSSPLDGIRLGAIRLRR